LAQVNSDKLEGVQLARAAAAIGIAYFHSWHVTMPFPPGTSFPIPLLRDYGWIAVDFFFAISGFVICLVATSANFRPISFLIRRALRIYPLWIATSFIYLYLTFYLGRGPQQTFGYFAYSLTLLPTNGLPFYDLGWSLQHEMAFYLMASIVAPWLGLWGLAGALMLGIVADHLLTLPWYLHQYFSYYGNFLAGIAAFATYRRMSRLGAILPLLISASAFLWVAPLATTPRDLYPLGLYFALIAFLNLKTGSTVGRIGTLLGDATYSIYLIHALVFYFVYIKLQPPLPPIWTQEFLRFGAIGITCALALVSWEMFERPINRFGNRFSPSAA
jgi:peptidoglycan/LPS O-acetylase OafA/YrhL